MHAYAANVYRRVDLGSAPKHQVVERLYDRFAQDIEAARAALATRDIKAKASSIDHAMRIVGELTAALDHAAAPELCANLAALYDFVIHRLTEANTSLAAPPLDQAARVMTELGTAFKKAHAK